MDGRDGREKKRECVARLRANQIIKNANQSPLRVKICRTCKRGYIGRFNPGGRCQCFCVLAAAHMGQMQGKKKVGLREKGWEKCSFNACLYVVACGSCIKSWRLLYCKLTSEQPLLWITFGSFGDLSLSGAGLSARKLKLFVFSFSVPTYAFNKWKSRGLKSKLNIMVNTL